MEPLDIKGVCIGCGAPKTIVSIMAPDIDGALAVVRAGREAGVDCFEWRADSYPDLRDTDGMVQMGRALASAVPRNPLIFTFRSIGQGGCADMPGEDYVLLNRAIIEAGAADIVDIESRLGDDAVRSLADFAKGNGVAVIVSHHDFEGTPPRDRMIAQLVRLQDLGADIPKLAVMAHNAADTLELLAATEEMSRVHARGPVLTMAMGCAGIITRLVGEEFGSALTFCALDEVSAPGQVDAAMTRRLLDLLHEALA